MKSFLQKKQFLFLNRFCTTLFLLVSASTLLNAQTLVNNGSGTTWQNMANSTDNNTQATNAGIGDNNLTADITLSDVAAVNYLQAAGLIWTSAQSTPLTTTTTTPPPSGYRYLRLTILGGVSAYEIYITEIDWLEGSTVYPTTDAIAGSTFITASNDQANAYKLSDGIKNSSSIWQAGTASPQNIVYDLGAGVAINPISVQISMIRLCELAGARTQYPPEKIGILYLTVLKTMKNRISNDTAL